VGRSSSIFDDGHRRFLVAKRHIAKRAWLHQLGLHRTLRQTGWLLSATEKPTAAPTPMKASAPGTDGEFATSDVHGEAPSFCGRPLPSCYLQAGPW